MRSQRTTVDHNETLNKLSRTQSVPRPRTHSVFLNTRMCCTCVMGLCMVRVVVSAGDWLDPLNVYDDETRSTLRSTSTTDPALFTESVSALVYNQVHQKQHVCESPSRSK